MGSHIALAFVYGITHLHLNGSQLYPVHHWVSTACRERRAPRDGQGCAGHSRQASFRGAPVGGPLGKTPTIIAAIIAGLAAITVALINQLAAPKPKSSEPTSIDQQTHGPNSPAIAHVQGDVNITYPGISAETFQALAAELGVTDAALKSFFTILEQQHVPR